MSHVSNYKRWGPHTSTPNVNESCHIMSHMLVGHIIRINSLCDTYKWVMSRIKMIHVTHNTGWVPHRSAPNVSLKGRRAVFFTYNPQSEGSVRELYYVSVLQCVTVRCSVLQCVAVCCSVLQCVAVCCSVLQCVLQYVAVSCSVCCIVLQCRVVCCSVCGSVMQCVAVFGGVMQCDAVCCSVMQCAAVCCSVLQCAAVWCSVLQCFVVCRSVAVCCSVLQCVAACCSVPKGSLKSQCAVFFVYYPQSETRELYNVSVLQCVAICCSALQCVVMCHSRSLLSECVLRRVAV